MHKASPQSATDAHAARDRTCDTGRHTAGLAFGLAAVVVMSIHLSALAEGPQQLPLIEIQEKQIPVSIPLFGPIDSLGFVITQDRLADNSYQSHLTLVRKPVGGGDGLEPLGRQLVPTVAAGAIDVGFIL